MEPKNCFVIIGYGKKTSYINGKARLLDLDETYTVLIKPVFDALNIPCYRAIDKNVSGSIDRLMLHEIKNADIAIADISTLNANVMWELGVRHALKPLHTIMICEKEQMSSIPFDVHSFVIHSYTHSEEGIPYREVERFRKYLTESVTKLLSQDPPVNDSPVFTFLEEELLNTSNKNSAMESSNAPESGTNTESFADIMNKAEAAKNNKDFATALEALKTARSMASQNMALKDNVPLVVSRQALCTYKSKQPNELEALVNAKIILDELKPLQSQDIEVLGLSGAINKRLYELTKDTTYLDNAILSYDKGFQYKQDYYNGINAAFVLYKKASLMTDENTDKEDMMLKADYIRNVVLKTAAQREADPGFSESGDAIWVLLTMAEAYHYKQNAARQQEYEAKADAMAQKTNNTFAMSSYMEQKEKIKDIFQHLV